MWWSGEQQGPKSVNPAVTPRALATHRGARAVLPPLWDLCLVGVVGAADHGAGGRQPPAPASSSTAARLPAWQALLLQLRLPSAGWAAFGVQGCGGWATWWREGTVRACFTSKGQKALWEILGTSEFLTQVTSSAWAMLTPSVPMIDAHLTPSPMEMT